MCLRSKVIKDPKTNNFHFSLTLHLTSIHFHNQLVRKFQRGTIPRHKLVSLPADLRSPAMGVVVGCGPRGLRLALALVLFPVIDFLPSCFKGFGTVGARLAWWGLGTERATQVCGGFVRVRARQAWITFVKKVPL